MLFHVLTHVELDNGVFVIKEELGQGLGQFGLAHACWPQEDKGSTGTLGVLQTGARTANGTAERDDRLVLANDALVQLVFHAQQFGRLFFGQSVDRDAGPHGQHFGDGLLVHEVKGFAAGGLGCRVQFVLARDETALLLFEGLGLLEGAALHGRLLVGAHACDVLVETLDRWRGVHAANTQATAGLIDEVNSLIGQESVRDIAVR